MTIEDEKSLILEKSGLLNDKISHRGYDAYRLINQFKILNKMCSINEMELFRTLSMFENVDNLVFGGKVDEAIEKSAIKLYNYIFLVVARKENYFYTVKKYFRNTQLKANCLERTTDYGNSGVISFVELLRNHMAHNGFPHLYCHQRFKENECRSGLTFKKNFILLLGCDDFGAKGKIKEQTRAKIKRVSKYVGNYNHNMIFVSDLLRDYVNLIGNFYVWFYKEIDCLHRAEYVDYWKICDNLESLRKVNE